MFLSHAHAERTDLKEGSLTMLTPLQLAIGKPDTASHA